MVSSALSGECRKTTSTPAQPWSALYTGRKAAPYVRSITYGCGIVGAHRPGIFAEIGHRPRAISLRRSLRSLCSTRICDDAPLPPQSSRSYASRSQRLFRCSPPAPFASPSIRCYNPPWCASLQYRESGRLPSVGSPGQALHSPILRNLSASSLVIRSDDRSLGASPEKGDKRCEPTS